MLYTCMCIHLHLSGYLTEPVLEAIFISQDTLRPRMISTGNRSGMIPYSFSTESVTFNVLRDSSSDARDQRLYVTSEPRCATCLLQSARSEGDMASEECWQIVIYNVFCLHNVTRFFLRTHKTNFSVKDFCPLVDSIHRTLACTFLQADGFDFHDITS